ncbi:MAG: acyltransferase [Holophagales bacterium]|nr:acyltransferase [Holophagales bacterium]
MGLPARIAPLDGLRGLAVLAVILYHATLFEPAEGFVGRAILGAARLGWAGVDLFFVLSGFLITRILVQSRGARNYFRVFYTRRCLRIFPLYYASLLLLVLLFHVSGRESLWYWLYASNVKMTIAGWPAAPLSHFWSLAVEEQYYLVWPLVVSLLPRRALAGLCAGLVLLVPAARVAGFLLGVPDVGLYVLTPFRLDGLAAGSLLALVVPRLPEPRRYVPHALATLFLAALATGLVIGSAGDAFWGTPPMLTLGFTSLAIAFAALVFLAIALPREALLPRLLEWRPLRAAGKVSYAMYVFHWPVTFALREAGLRPAAIAPGAAGWAGYLAVLLGSISLLAALSWKVLEGPCLALKDRIDYRTPGEVRPKG